MNRLAEGTRSSVCDACGRKSLCTTEANYRSSAGLLMFCYASPIRNRPSTTRHAPPAANTRGLRVARQSPDETPD